MQLHKRKREDDTPPPLRPEDLLPGLSKRLRPILQHIADTFITPAASAQRLQHSLDLPDVSPTSNYLHTNQALQSSALSRVQFGYVSFAPDFYASQAEVASHANPSLKLTEALSHVTQAAVASVYRLLQKCGLDPSQHPLYDLIEVLMERVNEQEREKHGKQQLLRRKCQSFTNASFAATTHAVPIKRSRLHSIQFTDAEKTLTRLLSTEFRSYSSLVRRCNYNLLHSPDVERILRTIHYDKLCTHDVWHACCVGGANHAVEDRSISWPHLGICAGWNASDPVQLVPRVAQQWKAAFEAQQAIQQSPMQELCDALVEEITAAYNAGRDGKKQESVTSRVRAPFEHVYAHVKQCSQTFVTADWVWQHVLRVCSWNVEYVCVRVEEVVLDLARRGELWSERIEQYVREHVADGTGDGDVMGTTLSMRAPRSTSVGALSSVLGAERVLKRTGDTDAEYEREWSGMWTGGDLGSDVSGLAAHEDAHRAEHRDTTDNADDGEQPGRKIVIDEEKDSDSTAADHGNPPAPPYDPLFRMQPREFLSSSSLSRDVLHAWLDEAVPMEPYNPEAQAADCSSCMKRLYHACVQWRMQTDALEWLQRQKSALNLLPPSVSTAEEASWKRLLHEGLTQLEHSTVPDPTAALQRLQRILLQHSEILRSRVRRRLMDMAHRVLALPASERESRVAREITAFRSRMRGWLEAEYGLLVQEESLPHHRETTSYFSEALERYTPLHDVLEQQRRMEIEAAAAAAARAASESAALRQYSDAVAVRARIGQLLRQHCANPEVWTACERVRVNDTEWREFIRWTNDFGTWLAEGRARAVDENKTTEVEPPEVQTDFATRWREGRGKESGVTLVWAMELTLNFMFQMGELSHVCVFV